MSKLKVKSGAAEPVSLLPINSIEDHQSEALGAAVFTPTRPAGVVRNLLVQAITQNIRFTLAATSAPTASSGFQLLASDPPVLIPIGPDVTPKFFREVAGAILEYQWAE